MQRTPSRVHREQPSGSFEHASLRAPDGESMVNSSARVYTSEPSPGDEHRDSRHSSQARCITTFLGGAGGDSVAEVDNADGAMVSDNRSEGLVQENIYWPSSAPRRFAVGVSGWDNLESLVHLRLVGRNAGLLPERSESMERFCNPDGLSCGSWMTSTCKVTWRGST